MRRLYNATIPIEDTDIILSTLWGHIPPENKILCAELVADFIAQSGADYWIYGQSHRNICTAIGTTRCLSNQLGYIHVGEGRDFNPAACINTDATEG